MRACVLAGGVAIALAGCDAPQQQTVPPANMEVVAQAVEQNFRAQIGKVQGTTLKYRIKRVSRKDNNIRVGLLFEDDLIIQLAKADPQKFSDGFQTGFARSFCGNDGARLMVNSGLSVTNDFLDRAGRTIFSRTLDKC